MNSLRKICILSARNSNFSIKHCNKTPWKNTHERIFNRLKPTTNFQDDKISIRLKFNDRLGISNYNGRYSNKYGSDFGFNHQPLLSILPYSSQSLMSVRLYSTKEIKLATKSYKCENVKVSTDKTESSELPGNEDESNEKLSLFQRFKRLYRDYWYVLIPVHCASSICWFGGFYVCAKSGVDIVPILEFLHISERLIAPFREDEGALKQAGLIAVTFAIYKLATPVRYAVTLGGTTVAINHLKKIGYIKPIPRKEKLKEMYLERKDILLEKRQQIRENVIQHFKEVERRRSKRTDDKHLNKKD